MYPYIRPGQKRIRPRTSWVVHILKNVDVLYHQFALDSTVAQGNDVYNSATLNSVYQASSHVGEMRSVQSLDMLKEGVNCICICSLMPVVLVGQFRGWFGGGMWRSGVWKKAQALQGIFDADRMPPNVWTLSTPITAG